MPIKFSNNAATTLTAGIADTDNTVAVVSAAGFPTLGASDYFIATIISALNPASLEVVRVTGVSGNTLSITRAQEGTIARSFDTNDVVELRVTAAGLHDLAYPEYTELTSDTTVTTGTPYKVTANDVTLTLPAGVVGAEVPLLVADVEGLRAEATGSDKFFGQAEPLALNINKRRMTLHFLDATTGWIVI